MCSPPPLPEPSSIPLHSCPFSPTLNLHLPCILYVRCALCAVHCVLCVCAVPDPLFCVQAGHVSPTSLNFTWYVASAAPSVAVLSSPDAVSSSWLPIVRVASRWASPEVPVGVRVTFEFLVLGDKSLGQFHAPPACNASQSLGLGVVGE